MNPLEVSNAGSLDVIQFRRVDDVMEVLVVGCMGSRERDVVLLEIGGASTNVILGVGDRVGDEEEEEV